MDLYEWYYNYLLQSINEYIGRWAGIPDSNIHAQAKLKCYYVIHRGLERKIDEK